MPGYPVGSAQIPACPFGSLYLEVLHRSHPGSLNSGYTAGRQVGCSLRKILYACYLLPNTAAPPPLCAREKTTRRMVVLQCAYYGDRDLGAAAGQVLPDLRRRVDEPVGGEANFVTSPRE